MELILPVADPDILERGRMGKTMYQPRHHLWQKNGRVRVSYGKGDLLKKV